MLAVVFVVVIVVVAVDVGTYENPAPMSDEDFHQQFDKYVVHYDPYDPDAYMDIGADCMIFNNKH